MLKHIPLGSYPTYYYRIEWCDRCKDSWTVGGYEAIEMLLYWDYCPRCWEGGI